MTSFLLIAVLLVSIAIAIVGWPLWRERASEPRGALWALIGVAVLLSAGTTLLYRQASNWEWDPALRAEAESGVPPEVREMVRKLESRLKEKPDDVQGWMMLGRSRFALKDLPGASQAFGEAYTRSGHQNVDATVGLGVALVLQSPDAFPSRAVALFAEALALDPDNADALFYHALANRATGHLEAARSEWITLLRKPEPEDVRAAVLERLTEVDQALGRDPDPELAALLASGSPKRSVGRPEEAPAISSPGPGQVTVDIRISPALVARIPKNAPLFVLARDPSQPGPPFAAKRFSQLALPAVVSLSQQDALMPGRTLKDAHQLVVVARFSSSGAPVAASGDVYGEVAYDLAKGDTVVLTIDRVMP